jgi:2,5-diamino-6-(ribosylamino)-4(3H)-pyrimidinone 5'-phosphate reductase
MNNNMKKPYVIVNCAMSSDGKIALPNKTQMKISSDEDMKRVYELRNKCDAVLVGINTVLSDDPKLTVKKTIISHPTQPLRVILDAKARTPNNSLVVNDDAKTMICTTHQNSKTMKVNNAEIVGCPESSSGFLDLKYILKILHDKGIRLLLVEGGSTILWSFFSQNLVDEFFVYIAPLIIGGEKTPSVAGGTGILNEQQAIGLHLCDIQKIGEGILLHYTL